MSLSAVAVGMASMAQHSFFYDTYHPDNSSFHIVTDSYTLDACTDYTITVDGTYSIWASGTWSGSCGPTEANPIFPSVNDDGEVGFDYAYIFALNNSTNPNCGSLPLATSRIQISLDNGLSWNHYPPSVPGYNTSHSYTFTVPGSGNPIQVRHVSMQNSDDYGQLRFTIEPILVDPCDFIPQFAYEQNKCVVDFMDISAYPCNSGFNVIGQHWDFGDGTTSTDANPSHIYAETNTYEVTYTVWATNGEDCCKKSFVRRIDAEACDPCTEILELVAFDYTLDGNSINVVETGIAAQNTANLVIGYLWDFGDGTTTTGMNATHNYSSAGVYDVCLTVFYTNEKSGDCCSVKKCVRVEVTEGASMIQVKEPTGTNNNFLNLNDVEELSIYPNPSNGIVNLTIENDFIDMVLVYDRSGKIVHKQQNNNEPLMRADLSKLNPGNYIVVAEGLLGKRYTGKIILE